MLPTNTKGHAEGNPEKPARLRQIKMNTRLTEDILRLLGQTVDCRATLSALCRVSKTFLRVFQPALYRRICLEHYSSPTIASISRLPKDSHLKFTEDFHIGQRTSSVGGDRYEPDHEAEVEALNLSLQKMINLRSFTIMGPLLRHCADSVSEDGGDSDDEEDHSSRGDDLKFNLLQRLARCEKLKHLTLMVIDACHEIEFTWRIPPLRNLRTLALFGLERSSFHDNVDDIAEVLLSSPELTSLGLSLKTEPGLDNDMLRKLINYYQLKRKERGTLLLRLSKLRLGLGFLPSAPRFQYMEDDYLKDLTDLTALKELHINNWNLDPDWDVPYWEIHPTLFIRATHLRKILVERLSPDIVELINLLKSSGSGTVSLDEIEVSRYFETVEPIQQGEAEEFFDGDFQGKPLYSLPLEQTGLHWRRVSYGAKLKNDKQNMAEHLLHNFVARCPNLEELSIPMSSEHVEFFKSSVIPKARGLHTLILPRGHIADLVPSLPHQIDRERMCKRIKLEYDEELQKIEREQEKWRIDFVTDLFAVNRHLVLQNSDIAPLRYIGVGTHVYCCMLPAPSISNPEVSIAVNHSSSDGTTTVEKYQIVKLSSDQARAFPSVRRLDTEDTSFF